MDEKNFDAKRRNLLLVASILIFLKYADAQIQGSATLSVLKFEIRNPEAILQTLWLLWAYTFARAYQHFRYHLLNDYERSIQKISAPILHPFVAGTGVPDEQPRFFFEDMERFHQYELSFCRGNIIGAIAYPFWWARYTAALLVSKVRKCHHDGPRLKINLIGNYRPHNFIPPRRSFKSSPNVFWKIKVWTITDRTTVGAGKLPIEVVAEASLGLSQGLRLQLRLLYSLFLRSAPFFEYRLPFLYALIPLPYYAFL